MSKSINQIYKEMGGPEKGSFKDFMAWYTSPKILDQPKTETNVENKEKQTTTTPDKKILGMKQKTFCYVALGLGVSALSYGLYAMYSKK